MSIKIMNQVWGLELPSGETIVLLALADHAKDDGTNCYPGVLRLAWKTGLSKRQIQRVLRGLESKGIISPVRYTQGGRGHATEYCIQVEKGVRKSPFISVEPKIPQTKSDMVSPIPETERVTSATERVTSATEKGDTMSPQPSIGTVTNHQEEGSPTKADDSSFADFWDEYPLRKGKRLNKKEALKVWNHMSRQDRDSACVAVKNYAATCNNGGSWPKDAHRWLRDRLYVEWLTPAEPIDRRNGHVPFRNPSPGEYDEAMI